MKIDERRQLGSTPVNLTPLGLGGAPLGELFSRVSDETARATLAEAGQSGIRYYDTSPWYGRGLSERRFGDFIRNQKPRTDYVLSTKIGRVFSRPVDPDAFDKGFWTGGLDFDLRFDYTYDGVMRSYEDSLQRLGINRIDLLLIHDLDIQYHGSIEQVTAYLDQLSKGRGWRALEELKSSGQIRGIGAGINESGMIPRFLERFPIDFFLVALPYNLLDQPVLDHEFPLCEKHGAGIVIGSVFSSGITATGAVPGAKYNYADPSPEIVDKVNRIQAVCARHNVPMAAAALQFPLGHRLVASVIPGAIKPEQVGANVTNFGCDIPDDLWAELKAECLLREDAPTPKIFLPELAELALR